MEPIIEVNNSKKTFAERVASKLVIVTIVTTGLFMLFIQSGEILIFYLTVMYFGLYTYKVFYRNKINVRKLSVDNGRLIIEYCKFGNIELKSSELKNVLFEIKPTWGLSYHEHIYLKISFKDGVVLKQFENIFWTKDRIKLMFNRIDSSPKYKTR
ncbi:MAG: hypothetical protein R2794_10860 [Chitinophagales bacterium]